MDAEQVQIAEKTEFQTEGQCYYVNKMLIRCNAYRIMMAAKMVFVRFFFGG